MSANARPSIIFIYIGQAREGEVFQCEGLICSLDEWHVSNGFSGLDGYAGKEFENRCFLVVRDSGVEQILVGFCIPVTMPISEGIVFFENLFGIKIIAGIREHVMRLERSKGHRIKV